MTTVLDDTRGARSSRWRFIAVLITALGMLLALTPMASADHGDDPNDIPRVTNPPFPSECGIDVAVVLDTSNSIFNDSPANPGIMKDAAKAFVDALAGTPSRVGVYSFQTSATLELGLTSVQTPAGATSVKSAIDGVVFGENSPTGGTNWEDGFLVASGQGVDLVAFATDGNPTTHNGDGDPGFPPGEPEDLAAGITAANVVKTEGSRIVGIGIGGAVNVDNLIAVSGPTANDDYYLPGSFTEFEAILQQIASRLCAPAVTVTKLVGDGAGNFSLGAGWQFDLAVDPALPVTADPSGAVTGAPGTVTFTWDATGTSTVQLTEVVQAGFRFDSASCELADGTPVSTSPIADGVALAVNLEEIVKCEFRNVPAPGAIEVVKTPSTTVAQVGDTVTYDYVVTNTGQVPLTGVALVDDRLGPITLAATALAPSESTTGTATYVVTAADLPGPIVNVATATGTDPGGTTLTDDDTATVDLAAIEVVKVADVAQAEVGDTITYTYTVTNVGSAALTDVAVVDDKLGPITLATTALAPGASTTGTATYTVVAGDLPGPIVNVATATGTDPDGGTVEDQDDETVPLTGQPGIEVVKTADVQIAGIGEVVTYTYAITNTGTLTLTDVTVTDDRLGPIALATTTLAPGASTTGTATYTVTAADLPGPIVNVATATGTDPTGITVTDEDDETVGLRAIQIEKVADLVEAEVGDTITYTYTVTNTGSVTLTNITVIDDKLGPITLATTTLAPGESTTGTAAYTVTEDDLPGPIVNVAVASGEDPDGTPTDDEDDEEVPLAGQPAIDVVKTADAQIAGVGETITYSYTVTNTGDVPLSNVTLVDDRLGPITLATTTLAPGQSTTGTATYLVTAADLPGPIVNVATASGTDPDGITVTDEDDETVGLRGIAIEKVADRVEAEVGDTITYTYTVTNIGSVTLTNITVVDDKLGPITLATTTLAPGESTTGTATYTVTEDDLPGPIVNVAVASGEDPDGTPTDDEDDEEVPLAGQPAIEVVKTADLGIALALDRVTYTYVVTNTGTVTLTDVTLEDDRLGSIELNKTTLEPGERTTARRRYQVRGSDFPGPIINVATATGTDPDGTQVSDQDDQRVELAAIDVTKVADLANAAIGDVITYTYTVTNTGSVTLSEITLDDDRLGPITPEQTTLEPGESTTATATYTVVDADAPDPIVNIVLGTGVTPDDPITGEPRVVADEDDEIVPLVIVLPTTVPPTTVPLETLPKTGADSDRIAGTGVTFLLVGALLLLLLATPLAQRHVAGETANQGRRWKVGRVPVVASLRHRRGHPVISRMPSGVRSKDEFPW